MTPVIKRKLVTIFHLMVQYKFRISRNPEWIQNITGFLYHILRSYSNSYWKFQIFWFNTFQNHILFVCGYYRDFRHFEDSKPNVNAFNFAASFTSTPHTHTHTNGVCLRVFFHPIISSRRRRRLRINNALADCNRIAEKGGIFGMPTR